MRKVLLALSVIFALGLVVAAPAGAQDETVIGSVVSDPATVPAAGEYTLTANGSGFIPDTQILLGQCTIPGDTLVPGVATEDEIVAALGTIDALADCDVATAAAVQVDADGNFTQEFTATVGDNFAFSAGALDGSQAGATWIPIVGDAALAVTGVDSWAIAMMGLGLLAVGGVALYSARRFEIA